MGNFPKGEVEELLKRIRNNDLSAFDRLFQLKRDSLLRLAYTYLHDTMLAEDAVQDAFSEFLRERKRFKNDKNLNGWLNVTTIHKALNIIKKRKFEVFIEDCQTSERFCNNSHDEQIHINDCLTCLNENERKVLFLKDYGYTIGETARLMGITFKQARCLLDEAKNKFIEIYKKI